METPGACPSDDELGMLGAGMVDGERLVELELHVDRCTSCRHALAAAVTGSGLVPQAEAGVLAPGQVVGRYEIERLLAAGGMGVVYVASDPKLGRRVALKVMRRRHSNPQGRARMLREAQAMALLTHPAVLSVYDTGELDGRLFLATEYVEGGTLRDWMKAHHSWREVVALFVMAGEGLAAAHRAGVVHRDFKPDNVLIGADGQPRVADFGLARPQDLGAPLARQATQITQVGMLLGTPAYMSPEQLTGRPADARSDQFAFCVCLFEALTGKRPFDAQNIEAQRGLMASGMPRPPLVTPVPRAVWAVVARGLSVAPAARFADLDELLAALGASATRRASSSHFAAAVVAVGLAAAVLISLGYELGRANQPPPPLTESPADRGGVARVAISAPARTVVEVDGRTLGLSPVGDVSLPVGEHTFVFALEGLVVRQTTRLEAGPQQIVVTLTFDAGVAPSTGEVSFVTVPLGADIALDGIRFIGRTPLRLSSLDFGVHDVAFSLGGQTAFKHFEVTAEAPSQELTVEFSLLTVTPERIASALAAGATAAKRAPPAPRANGSDPQNLFAEAEEFMKQRQYQAAASRLDRCIAADPKAYECLRLRGTAAGFLQEQQNVVKYYRRYLEVAPPEDPMVEKVRERLRVYDRAVNAQ